MIHLIVACVFLAAPIPGPTQPQWQVAEFDAESGAFLPRPGMLCGSVGDTQEVRLVAQPYAPVPVTVEWLKDYDVNRDGVIASSDVMAQTNLTDFGAASVRLGELNDGQQVIE